MSLFKRKGEKLEKQVHEYFKLLAPYSPVSTTFDGSLYEMELTRAAIHAFATHASKLKPEVNGSRNGVLERRLQFKPNPLMDTKKYLYRLATVYMVDNTAFIVPLYDSIGGIVGYYPLATKKCQIVTDHGIKYLRYEISQGQYSAVELERVGILNQYQYSHELFGETNRCLRPTMDLITAQNQGIIEGVKNSANLRFIAKLANKLNNRSLAEERQRLKEENLGASNNGGVLLIDSGYEDIKQINSTPYVVNDAQAKHIRENVYNYFGVNDDILQNKFTSDGWSAYYEGKIEPFAIELSLVHTNMTFSEKEIAYGNQILFTANRLQYMSNTEKLNTVTQLFDRGFLTHNEGLEIFNMSPVEGGDKRYIRREYVETSQLGGEEIDNANTNEPGVPNGEPVAATTGGATD